MNKFSYYSSLLILVCFVLAACNETKSTTSTNATIHSEVTSPFVELKNTIWTLQEYQVNNTVQKISHVPTLSFDDAGNYGFQLNVNSCGGSYTINKNNIDFSNGGFCTEMCCDSKESKELFANFQKKATYSFNPETKLLEFRTSNSITTWQMQIALDEKVMNKKWKLSHFITKAASKPFEKDYFITFQKERVILQLDVNTCNTAYQAIDKHIVELKQPFGCSRMCCDSKQGLEIAQLLQGKITLNPRSERLDLNLDIPGKSIACIPANTEE